MFFVFKFKKIASSILILSILFSISPVFLNQASAQAAESATYGQASSIFSGAAGASATPASGLYLGTGFLYVSDPGVRYNTLAMLSSTMGLGPGEAQKEFSWDKIAYALARILVRQLTQSIVDWINSGFQGNPSFVQDPEGFMENLADRTIGEFIFSSDLNFLCDPFQVNVRLALGLQYSPFKDTINCRLTDVLKNTQGAYEDFVGGDFIGGGGWESWLSITTVPQNNQIGAMLIAQSELDARINNQSLLKKDELDRNQGFLSMKECERTTIDYTKSEGGESVQTKKIIKYTGDPVYQAPGTKTTEIRDLNNSDGGTYGTQTEKCKITTPGTMISDQMNRVTGLDMEALNMADELNEIVGALANFVISKAIEKGFAAITKEDTDPKSPSWRQGLAQMRAQAANAGGRGINDPYYYPDATEYDGGGSGIGSNDPQKQAILNAISNYQPAEEDYYLSYLSIYSAAENLRGKFVDVINCFNIKLASTTITYTTTERNEANTAINTASTTATQLETIKTEHFDEVKASENNLNSLQSITTSVNNATNASQISAAEASLSALIPSLHNQASSTEAQAYASSTILTKISPKGPIADNLQNQCNAFPNR